MMDKKDEERFQRSQLSIRDLTINMEKMEKEATNILDEAGMSYEQIKNYIEDPNNFSKPIWQQLQIERKELSAKLDMALQGIKDPVKLKKTFAERALVQPHWLFVR